jgi:HlyD family secretion protein
MTQATPAPDNWQSRIPTSYGRAILGGFLVLASFCGGFGLWAVTAPISGAVIATGVMRASGQNKLVDHLDGGVIASIPVHEGEAVKAGDILLTIDTTRTTAERDRISLALMSATAQLARARAEQTGAKHLVLPETLKRNAAAAGATGDIEQQMSEFDNRRTRHIAELSAIDQRVRAAEEEIAGLVIQKNSEERKLAVLREDLSNKESLLAKGLVPKVEVNSLRRSEADSMGVIGSLTARIGERRSAIAELYQQTVTIEARRREAASSEVSDLSAKIADLTQQLRRQEDILAKSVIRAPDDGIILRLPKNTVGSALKAGDTVAEILPTANELLVEARIAPQDIDTVRVGQAAQLRLVAFNSKTTPDVAGEVSYVSADRFTDPNGHESFYTARIRLSGPLPQELAANRIQSGMPVEAFIKTGDRTFFAYLIQPLEDSFSKAFREP